MRRPTFPLRPLTPSLRAPSLAILVLVLGLPLGVTAGLATAADGPTDEAPGDTIVDVTGDAGNGFGIHHLDGTALYPPTDSEALAECSAYERFGHRVRCRTEVRTWYRDLADLQQALEHAHDAAIGATV
ncbi:hypothetical protein [Nocardioides bruguierae]|uniref:Uncharacterized protein n=1 Tax=Nocardioides bruguierae TaxID=2945102 RepID=A0A9X2D8P2_9ACTN|nr:hypothetical protein [Nocardioides bruguierae]MCM0620114.1 hypothetical protein [Nocardioides bruguierae]